MDIKAVTTASSPNGPILDEVVEIGSRIYDQVRKETRSESANYERMAGGLRVAPIYEGLLESVTAYEARQLAEDWRARPEGLETRNEGAGEISSEVIYGVDALRDLMTAYRHSLYRSLCKIREIGDGLVPGVAFEPGSWTEAMYAIEGAAHLFPTDWLIRSARAGQIKATIGVRGVYRSWAKAGYSDCKPLQPLARARIRLTRAEIEANAVHELAHRFQDVVPNLAWLEGEFYRRRTSGSEPYRLPGYRIDDLFRDGEFFVDYAGRDPYLDKECPSPGYEVFPVGVEALFGQDLDYFERFILYDDAEHESFVLGVLAAL